jgi:cell division protein FtsI/penicillin-binding protein 2
VNLRRILVALALCAAALPCRAQNDRLQDAADRALRHQRGAAIVLDLRTNKILAAHDLDIAGKRLATPGSTVKPFVLLKLLDLGLVKPSDRFVCPRFVTISGRRLDCTHPPLPGAIDPTDALAWSCNAFFAAASRRLPARELADTLRQSGFIATTELAPEATGQVRTASTTEQIQLQALGEWGVMATPLELLEAYRKLAQRRDEPNVQLVWLGLEHSVAYGMARAAKLDKVNIAGKTGTAAQPGGVATHGWFVGLAPAEKPEVAVVVYLERGRGLDAAALAQPILTEYFRGKQ